MELLGVGPTEFLFIIIIALIVLGPKDLAKTGKTIGKWLNNLVQSDTWKTVQKTSKELRRLPTQLMREDNLEKFLTNEKQPPASGTNAGTWSGKIGTENASPHAHPSPVSKNENTIHPPVTVDGPPAPPLEPAPKNSVAAPRKKATPAAKKQKAAPEKKSTPRKKSNA
jgi:sec-independent protein translocase protein TatB